MKRNILFIIITLFSISSCKKFLSQVPDDKLSIDDVFRKKTTTEQYLAGVYGYIRSQADWANDNSSNGTPWEGLSDELDVTYNDCPSYSMNMGQWDRNRGNYNFWSYYYKAIRTASYFMERVNECEEIQDELKIQYKAEARVLRAFFYFKMMRQYGPVIILPDQTIPPDAAIDQFSFARNTYDECVNYVVSEIDAALPDLPATFGSTQEYGRIKQPMALAIKARTLLYAASPLFNGNTDYADFKNYDGTQLVSQQVDVNKWKRAADASKAIIDLNLFSLYKELDGSGNLKTYESLKNLYLKDWNSEVIMALARDNQYSQDKNGSPYILGGWSSYGPTQSAVDAYFMANGRSIDDPASGYTEAGFTGTATSNYASGTSNMYVNREPRFYVAITFNLSKWINNYSNNTGGTGSGPITVQLYKGGNSGQYTGRNWSRTGYVCRKMVNPSSVMGLDKIAARTEILFRLGEVYLNYAEALNEYNPGDADIKKYINLIRERAGIPQYGTAANQVPEPVGQAAWREAIRKERRVELAFENHRYFDTRRWKIAEQTDGGAFYGMDVNATNTTDFTKRVIFENRVFLKKNYLWNIVQSELDKDKNLVENPGW